MRQYGNGSGQVTIGLDLGDRTNYFKVLDEGGELVEEGRVAITSSALQNRFGRMEAARIA